jgi:cytochrome c peroxidase
MTPRCYLRRAQRVAALVVASLATTRCERSDTVANPHPAVLVRPRAAPLSAMAELGRAIFYDSTLSTSGTRSCASCHRPENAYASPVRSSSMLATTGDTGRIARAIPSLRYAYRAPDFSIGPELSDVDASPSTTAAPLPPGSRPVKIAGGGSRGDVMVARGGLFWDGRANTLQDQAMGPLFNPSEMGNTSVATVAGRLRGAKYAPQFVTLFGLDIFAQPARLVDEAMFAVARFQIEDRSFHPYTSKYDYFLEGKARLTQSEWRGLQAFDDPKRGNCAACHLDRARGDGLPPVFTDYEYEALGIPRDTSIARGIDLGACGPLRTDLRDQPRFCGMFRTPSLRNTATRSEFFHNGVYRTLEDVLAFYNFRETHPAKIYPTMADSVAKFNDLPARYHGNVDTSDAPLDRKPGQPSPMTKEEMRDVVAFLNTLNDGYVLNPRGASRPD